MRPLVTTHDIEVLGLQEILVVLCIGREGQVVLALLCKAIIAKVEVFLSPRRVCGALLTVGPVAREVRMQAQILKAVYLIINLHITHIIERVGAVIALVQQSYGVIGGISLLGIRVVRVIQ